MAGEHLFTPEALKTLVEQNMPTDAQPGEKVVIGTVDSNGAQVVASFKLKEHWEIQAAARHDWNNDNTVGAKVLLRW